MKDFLAGTFGKFLQLVLSVLGLVFLIVGFVSCASENVTIGAILFLLGILCFCAVFGVRYWLGHIMRLR